MPAPPPRLVLFTGIGVDHRLFNPQRRGLRHVARVETPDWIDPLPEETVADYARRMLAQTVDLSGDPAPLFLGGVSFGAMVALEVARALESAPSGPKPRGVFNIGGCHSHRQIAGPVRLLGEVTGRSPTWAIGQALRLAPLVVRLVGRPARGERRLLLRMVPDAHLAVTRWGARAIMRWEFRGRLACREWVIHGGQDRIVPAENVRPPDLLVPEAGHIVNVTHAGVVNEFIKERMKA